jgi:gluconolactonase
LPGSEIRYVDADCDTAAFDVIWNPATPVRRIVEGMRFTEGPVWHPQAQYLTFSDIPASRIYRWSETLGLDVLVAQSNKTNGNAYDAQGRLVSCEHLTSRVVRRDGDAVTLLADAYDGRELNSPNDLIVAPDGSIFFSDPPYGRKHRAFGGPRPVPQAVNGLYRIDPTGALTRVAEDFDLPNGLCLSADGRHLFVADSGRCHIRRFAIGADGNVNGGAVWADVPSDGMAVPDGLKADGAGNVFCSGRGGIQVFDAGARSLGCIPVPELVANFTFGGPDLKTLFVAASRSIYATRVEVAGIPAF